MSVILDTPKSPVEQATFGNTLRQLSMACLSSPRDFKSPSRVWLCCVCVCVCCAFVVRVFGYGKFEEEQHDLGEAPLGRESGVAGKMT